MEEIQKILEEMKTFLLMHKGAPRVRRWKAGTIKGVQYFLATQIPDNSEFGQQKKRGFETVWLYIHKKSRPSYLARLSETEDKMVFDSAELERFINSA